MIKHLQVLHEAVLWMEEDVQGINKMDLEEKILMDDLLTLDVADGFCCFGLKFSGPGPHKLDWPKILSLNSPKDYILMNPLLMSTLPIYHGATQVPSHSV